MNLKDKLNNLKYKISNKKSSSPNKTYKVLDIEKNTEEYLLKGFESDKSANLNTKIDSFIEHCREVKKDKYSSIGLHMYLENISNFIEKMAVWYELRYPEYEVNRKMHCCGQEETMVDKEMFENNPYIQKLTQNFINRPNINLKWSEFYNAESFINSLPFEERLYFMKEEYPKDTYIENNGRTAYLALSPDGFVKSCNTIGSFLVATDFKLTSKDINGLHIKEVFELLKKEGIKIDEIENIIKRYEENVYFKDELLNCVMYRIIERGGGRIGPRRAFLFAKEFKRNIDIPMMYAVDYSDPGLRNFINEYIKAGGTKELVCYKNYFTTLTQNKKLETVTVQELIKTIYNDCATKYTPEETQFHQKIVNILIKQVESEQQKIKQLTK